MRIKIYFFFTAYLLCKSFDMMTCKITRDKIDFIAKDKTVFPLTFPKAEAMCVHILNFQ